MDGCIFVLQGSGLSCGAAPCGDKSQKQSGNGARTRSNSKQLGQVRDLEAQERARAGAY